MKYINTTRDQYNSLSSIRVRNIHTLLMLLLPLKLSYPPIDLPSFLPSSFPAMIRFRHDFICLYYLLTSHSQLKKKKQYRDATRLLHLRAYGVCFLLVLLPLLHSLQLSYLEWACFGLQRRHSYSPHNPLPSSVVFLVLFHFFHHWAHPIAYRSRYLEVRQRQLGFLM